MQFSKAQEPHRPLPSSLIICLVLLHIISGAAHRAFIVWWRTTTEKTMKISHCPSPVHQVTMVMTLISSTRNQRTPMTLILILITTLLDVLPPACGKCSVAAAVLAHTCDMPINLHHRHSATGEFRHHTAPLRLEPKEFLGGMYNSSLACLTCSTAFYDLQI